MTPKQILLESAAENPGSILLVTLVNNEIKCSITYQNPAEALHMQFILDEKLKSLIRERMPNIHGDKNDR